MVQFFIGILLQREAGYLDNCGDLIPWRNEVIINSYEEKASRNLVHICVSKFWSPRESREGEGDMFARGLEL